MAERRMFAKMIIDSDVFLDMPLSTQALYFHLSMRADDEGFINNPKKIMRMIGASQNELDILIAKRYLLTFESGVVVIKHWKIHNYIQNDRFKATLYKEERNQILVKENKSYTENNNPIIQVKSALDTECIQDGDTGKVREGKVSIGKSKRSTSSRFSIPTVQEITEFCKSRSNSVNAQRFFDYYESKGWKVGKSSMKDWEAAVRTWEGNGFSQKGADDNFRKGGRNFEL